MPHRILVIGGAGYIGSHTCKALKQAGYEPIVFDNLCYGHRDFVNWGPLVVGDTGDAASVTRAIEHYAAAAVMHFAAFAYVGESVIDPAKYYRNNVGGMLGVLDGMRAAGCNKLVFSSTCAVYGEPEVLPISEQTPTHPVNPYGRSKLMCEEISKDYETAYGVKTISLRYFNASGDDPGGEVGELRAVETHLIPRAMMALQGYIKDFEVFGSDFPTHDGTAIRDYIHVSDLADAHVLALRRLLDGGDAGCFNLGIGEGYSVNEVLSMISKVSGRNLPAPKGDRRAGDPAQLIADAAFARRELGFSPTRSSLHTIVETAWEWHRRAHPRRNLSSGREHQDPSDDRTDVG
jgi:UDP-arabinose 4-epimerase